MSDTEQNYRELVKKTYQVINENVIINVIDNYINNGKRYEDLDASLRKSAALGLSGDFGIDYPSPNEEFKKLSLRDRNDLLNLYQQHIWTAKNILEERFKKFRLEQFNQELSQVRENILKIKQDRAAYAKSQMEYSKEFKIGDILTDDNPDDMGLEIVGIQNDKPNRPYVFKIVESGVVTDEIYRPDLLLLKKDIVKFDEKLTDLREKEDELHFQIQELKIPIADRLRLKNEAEEIEKELDSLRKDFTKDLRDDLIKAFNTAIVNPYTSYSRDLERYYRGLLELEEDLKEINSSMKKQDWASAYKRKCPEFIYEYARNIEKDPIREKKASEIYERYMQKVYGDTWKTDNKLFDSYSYDVSVSYFMGLEEYEKSSKQEIEAIKKIFIAANSNNAYINGKISAIDSIIDHEKYLFGEQGKESYFKYKEMLKNLKKNPTQEELERYSERYLYGKECNFLKNEFYSSMISEGLGGQLKHPHIRYIEIYEITTKLYQEYEDIKFKIFSSKQEEPVQLIRKNRQR